MVNLFQYPTVAEPISVKSAVSICVNLREKGPPDASGLQEGKKGLGAIENLQDILNIWSLGVFTTKQY